MWGTAPSQIETQLVGGMGNLVGENTLSQSTRLSTLSKQPTERRCHDSPFAAVPSKRRALGKSRVPARTWTGGALSRRVRMPAEGETPWASRRNEKSAYLGILALIASISFWIKASAKSGTTSHAISWMIFSES